MLGQREPLDVVIEHALQVVRHPLADAIGEVIQHAELIAPRTAIARRRDREIEHGEQVVQRRRQPRCRTSL